MKGEELQAILEKVRGMPEGSPVSAYMERILDANEDAVKELSMSRKGIDRVMEECGFAAKWEARGREEGLREGSQKGREEGREEGLERGLEQVARNALAKGLPLEMIGEITGLDVKTIKQLSRR